MKLSFLFTLSLSSLILFSSPLLAEEQLVVSSTGDVTLDTAKPMNHDTATTHTVAAGDKLINNAVQKEFKKNKSLAKFKIKTMTHDGVVHLNGQVDSDSQFSTLVETANSIVGVKDVDTTNLTVKGSTQPVTDAVITAKVRGLFIKEKLFGKKDIAAINLNVETKNGVVYLTGIIDRNAQIDNAIKIIKTVNGVEGVEYKVVKQLSSKNTMTDENEKDDTTIKPSTE